jgi:hypothetical protein
MGHDSLRAAYEAWPDEVRDRFWRRVHHLLMWRDHDGKDGGSTHDCFPDLEAIAGLFWEHGQLGVGTYT